MSKMNELSMLLDNLIECGETLTETARALKAFYSSDNEPSAAPAKPLPPTEEPAAPEAKQPESKLLMLIFLNFALGREPYTN